MQRVRLYSYPYWNFNDSLSIGLSFVSAGGGEVNTRDLYVFQDGASLPPNAIGFPRADEIFVLEGVPGNRRLQSGDAIQLRASDGTFVAIDHDEEDHSDSIVTNDGPGDTWFVRVVEDQMIVGAVLGMTNGVDPCGPPQAIRLTGQNGMYLSFRVTGEEMISVAGVTQSTGLPTTFGLQTLSNDDTDLSTVFAIDYLPTHSLPTKITQRQPKITRRSR